MLTFMSNQALCTEMLRNTKKTLPVCPILPINGSDRCEKGQVCTGAPGCITWQAAMSNRGRFTAILSCKYRASQEYEVIKHCNEHAVVSSTPLHQKEPSSITDSQPQRPSRSSCFFLISTRCCAMQHKATIYLHTSRALAPSFLSL